MKSLERFLTVAVGLIAIVDCGGKVFTQSSDDTAPGTGTSTGTTTTTGTSTVTGTNPVTSTKTISGTVTATSTDINPPTGPLTGTGTTVPCHELCSYIYACGVQTGQCPGFHQLCVTLDAFLWGDANEGGCVLGCQTQPAIAALVDMNDCHATIWNLYSASDEFAAACDGVFCGGTDPGN